MWLAKIATFAKCLFVKNDTPLTKFGRVIMESGEYCASGHRLDQGQKLQTDQHLFEVFLRSNWSEHQNLTFLKKYFSIFVIWFCEICVSTNVTIKYNWVIHFSLSIQIFCCAMHRCVCQASKRAQRERNLEGQVGERVQFKYTHQKRNSLNHFNSNYL